MRKYKAFEKKDKLVNIWSKLKGKNVKFILNFCLLCLIFPKKNPPTPPHFPANVGSTPHTPPV